MNSLTIAVLSWGAHKTLRNTLESYRTSGLLSMANTRLIYFQEITPEDITIAKEFGFTQEGNSRNIGISGGYLNLLNRTASSSNFLFLENDWEAITSPKETERIIIEAQRVIDRGGVDLIRLRHRTNPGYPLWTRQFEGREYDRPTHLLDSVHWAEHPEKFKEIREILPGAYVTTSRNANWTNNPHLATQQLLKKYVAPQMSPLNDIERDLQPWWEQQNFKVMQGDGIFTHNRIG